jgi:hypothetical protein
MCAYFSVKLCAFLYALNAFSLLLSAINVVFSLFCCVRVCYLFGFVNNKHIFVHVGCGLCA